MSPFKKAVNEAMLALAADPRTVFVGQSVRYDGAAVFDSLNGVPMDRRLEMPVAEDFQLGFCTGLALRGRIPVCIYPRFDFVLLAANQLVNHLDKLPRFGWNPHLIIRTVVGPKAPLDAGPQHTQDHTAAFRLMLTSVQVEHVTKPHEVLDVYAHALAHPRAWLVVEHPA